MGVMQSKTGVMQGSSRGHAVLLQAIVEAVLNLLQALRILTLS